MARSRGPGPGADEQAAFAPFRPRRGRAVATASAVATVLLFAVVAVVLPGPAEGGNWRAGDRVFFAGVGVAIALLLWRFASIRAVPTRETLTIRNLFLTRTVSWREVVDVRFGEGDPWVTIELSDTDTVAVMAIQKADAGFGRAEAGRLAALVQALGPSVPSPDVTRE
ncbi:PH domain-containing protein [Phycicoccus sp. 3266]|uniref:PH domain-containing protein n=1 Tax=Phycicoccus sp. 3266 TaxID=2817751 RepID=UPI00285AE8C1|nr:PH domain-containing protein [Phycicoccus sp. 3266]MDR6865181.1 MFS family permease [Phycicoccus sp. 3266]